jgi:hypothetical protein
MKYCQLSINQKINLRSRQIVRNNDISIVSYWGIVFSKEVNPFEIEAPWILNRHFYL